MICAGTIPANVLYEDEYCMAFSDVNPVAEVHFLVIPKTAHKKGLSQLSKSNEQDHTFILGHCLAMAAKVAKQEGLADDGYRVVINDGKHGC